MRRLVAATLLTACAGLPENDFIVAYEVQFCTTYVACATDEMLQVAQERECLAWLRRQDYPNPPDCTYDRAMAQECLDALEAGECDEVDPALPPVCDDVYNGCPLPRLPKGGVPPNEE